MEKYVYAFGGGVTEGGAEMKMLLGNKGANLAEMSSLGLPVPPGFTITTEASDHYFKNGGEYPEGMWEEVDKNLARVEGEMEAKLGDPTNPLLVSVRSGAAVSMPGMMDTVLNLGLNDRSVGGLSARTDNPRFAWDSYRRLVTMFGDVVLGLERREFEERLEALKGRVGVKEDQAVDVESLQSLVKEYKSLVQQKLNREFPQDPREQLRLAINAVFDSWNSDRAKTYRRLNQMSEVGGTGVNVQAMVFGNLGETSGTGVAFTRNPSTGAKEFYGEFLMNAQGEDIVAGTRTAEPISSLKTPMPEVYQALEGIAQKLESHYKDMQDLEFTIQAGKLYMLQTRTGKRTAAAATRIATEMEKEGLIDKATALLRLDPEQMEQLLHYRIDPNSQVQVIARGLAASPGAAVGKAVFTAEGAEQKAAKGEQVILIRMETSPDDIGGMYAAQGILTARGGLTSHAAVVARGMGKCCVAGCDEIRVDEEQGRFTADSVEVREGDFITLNGSTGEVILGETNLVKPEVSDHFSTILDWTDEVKVLGVRANADTPHDAQVARDYGAEGIGLCRTEHMFFEGDRIDSVRAMILAKGEGERRSALKKLLPIQTQDFEDIFEVMDGLPVTIRFLDPPLHEFLPKTEDGMEALARNMGTSLDHIKATVEELTEFNPMLGHRGCRLGLSYPEIYEMQAEAIFTAACRKAREGRKVLPEIMIPLVADVAELRANREMVRRFGKEVMRREKVKVDYLIGTMIELPRACLTAREIAAEADFFSFGTNDLTQTVYGLSRDDVGRFLPEYLTKGYFSRDPFVAIDRAGVGEMIRMAVKKGRARRRKLKVGICGEHGGEPSSVEFCHQVNLDYVSCSPFRVVIARLAAAQAALRYPAGK